MYYFRINNIIKIIPILYFLKEIGQVAKLWRNLKTSQKFEGSKMNNEKDELKECIAREFEEIAREEEEFLENEEKQKQYLIHTLEYLFWKLK